MNQQKLDQSLFPFQSHFLSLNDHRIHYVDEGRGSPILFLHGNPTWSFLYRHLIKRCSRNFRCLALDYPGFGLSQAASGYGFTPREHSQVVEQFVLRLDLKDITLFVHDWGAPIGLGMAGRQPQRFSRFVIGNTFARPVDENLRLKLFSQLLGSPLGYFFICYFNAFVNVIIPLGMKQKPSDRQIMQMYRAPFPTLTSRKPTYIFPKAILNSREFLTEVYQGMGKLIDKPALIVWGSGDPAFGAKERQVFEELFSHHRTVILEGAGHFIQEDATDQIVEALFEWL